MLVLLLSALLASDPAAEVRAAAIAWTQAAVRQDRQALDRLFADEVIYAHSNGKVESKQEYLGAVTGGPPRYESMESGEVQTRVYGNTAYLTALIDVKIVGRDRFRVRSLQVFIFRDGRWQLTAHQSARVNP